MNDMSSSSWTFKGFDRICIIVNSDDLRSIGKWKYFDVMEFFEKYTRVDGSDDDMEHDAGGDEVNNLIHNLLMTKQIFRIKNQQIIVWWMLPEICEKPLPTNQ